MAYSSDKKPGELTALTSLATDDVIVVGDTSDASEVAKGITKANLITDLGSSFATAAHNHTGTYEPAKGTDDNYVTDAEKAALHTHSNKATLDNITAAYTTADASKLAGIEAGAEVNNISDVNATDLTDGGDTTLHTHSAYALSGHNHSGVYEPADATILKSAAIGVSVAAQSHNHTGVYAPVLGTDDNYVTDAEKTVIGNTSGTNTGNQTITNSSDGTSHTVTLSATGGSVKLVEGANVTLTTTGTDADGIVTIASTASGTGDVVGPASSVDNRVVFFNGTTGKLIKDSGLTLSGSNTGDQTSIVGITGTLAQFNTAVTDANLARTDAAQTFTGAQTFTNTTQAASASLGKSPSASIRLDIKADATYTQGIRVEADSTSRLGFSGFVTGDSFVRYTQNVSGTMEWGTGAAVADTQLSRTGVAELTTNGNIRVVDEAYGAGWNGSLGVPTKNALYDKIETLKRITKRVGSTTSSATPTINTDDYDIYKLTAQTVDITSFTTNLSGTPTDGQTLMIQITGTAARAITWGASFEASTVALPTTTVTTNRLDVEFIWNTATSKWRCIRVA